MSNYAAAVRKPGLWFGDGPYAGSTIVPNTGVIHTTEGTTLPTYAGGAIAPNYTGVPDFSAQTIAWIAHFPDEQSSRSLQNTAGGVETNTLNCVQIELVGTCNPASRQAWGAAQYIYWPEAPDWALHEVAKFVADMNVRHKIEISGPPTPWVAYPASYGLDASQRLSFPQWINFSGWCGHQHVPENDHGDPGNIPWAAIENYAKEIVAPTPVTPKTPIEVAYGLVVQTLNVVNTAIKKSSKPSLKLHAARTALRTAKTALQGDNTK